MIGGIGRRQRYPYALKLVAQASSVSRQMFLLEHDIEEAPELP
jgi:hypothetical protein